MTENITDGLLDPDMRCRIIRCDRIGHKRFEFVEIPAAKYFPLLEVACIDVVVEIECDFSPSIYRQPTYDATSVAYITQLTECFTKFANCKSPCYIVGDLNCPAIDWS